MVPTLVPTQASETSLFSVLSFLAGGGDELLSSMEMEGCIWTVDEAPTLACSGLAADPWAVAAAGLGGGPGDGPDAVPCGGPGPVLAGNINRGGPC